MRDRKHAITPSDKGPPPANPLYRTSPTVSKRIWRDDLDHSKGMVEVVEMDGMKWAEIVTGLALA